jgi:hypothetical protein
MEPPALNSVPKSDGGAGAGCGAGAGSGGGRELGAGAGVGVSGGRGLGLGLGVVEPPLSSAGSPPGVDPQRERIIRDPRVIEQSREGLNQDFDSEELAPEHPTAAAKGRNSEGACRKEPLTDVDGGK